MSNTSKCHPISTKSTAASAHWQSVGSDENVRERHHRTPAPRCGDAVLRRALIHRLASRHARHSDTLIVEELGLKHGRARVDVAVLNGRLEGFEIKSRMDTLARLPGQARTFSLIFDRITLVLDDAHLSKAIAIAPAWWGLTVAHVGQRGGVSLKRFRSAEQNPAVDPNALAKLLWREEALDFLEGAGLSQGLTSAPRKRLYERLVEVLSVTELKDLVRQSLKSRKTWRSDGLYRPGGG